MKIIVLLLFYISIKLIRDNLRYLFTTIVLREKQYLLTFANNLKWKIIIFFYLSSIYFSSRTERKFELNPFLGKKYINVFFRFSFFVFNM